MAANVSADIQAEINLSFEISNKIDSLIRTRGLSGQHNFTIDTIASIEVAVGMPIVEVV